MEVIPIGTRVAIGYPNETPATGMIRSTARFAPDRTLQYVIELDEPNVLGSSKAYAPNEGELRPRPL